MPYKVDSVTGEKSEYIFDFGGILALKNFTARTNGERLIIQSATNANFTILDALVSEVEIDGVVYDNATSAQEALQRLVFNPAVPVIMTLAQQQLLEGALQKGTYSGTASDLKMLLEDLIAQKVNKEENKGLISDTERTLIQENYNKRVVGQTITGDVNKVSTLILEDGSVIQAQFTDVAPAGPDVMLNSLNFNIQTGVLTGVRSDGQQLTVDLNGRYALLGHTHTIADVADLEDALNGKADAEHTHAFSEITGTEDIATKQDVTDAVISGRNLLMNSRNEIALYSFGPTLTEPLVEGEKYTLSFEAKGNLTGRVFLNGSVDAYFSAINTSEYKRFIVTFIYQRNDYQGRQIYPHIYGASHTRKRMLVKGNNSDYWSPAPEDFVSKSELEDVIDVDTIDEIGDFKPKSGNIRPHISPTGNFSVFAGEIGSGELLMQVDRTFGIKSPKHIDGKVVSGRKLRASVIDSSWVDLDSRNNELNVTNPANENDYVPVKAKGFKTPNGSVNEVLRADGSTALFMKGEEISGSVSWTANNRVRGNTIFLTGNGDKTIHLHQLENHSIMSFKKCYDGGVVTFQCSGKTIVMRGADAFNGKDGSNAVISIVGNKCYIDINNYE